MHRGRFKGFLPSNSWNDSTNGGGASIATIDTPYSMLYNMGINLMKKGNDHADYDFIAPAP